LRPSGLRAALDPLRAACGERLRPQPKVKQEAALVSSSAALRAAVFCFSLIEIPKRGLQVFEQTKRKRPRYARGGLVTGYNRAA
jgi:hypothetical protein